MENTIENNYKRLGTAICTAAVKDYKKALIENDDEKIKENEDFFRSDLFVFLSEGIISGNTLIKEIRAQYNK